MLLTVSRMRISVPAGHVRKKKKFGKSVTVSAEDALVSGHISFHAMRKHLPII